MRFKSKIMAVALLVAGTAFSLQSCNTDSDDTNSNMNYGMVTVRQNMDKLVLKIGNNVALTATNVQRSPYNKEVRAFAYLSDIDLTNKTCYVNRIDTFLTKNTIDYYDENANYGSDPVEIVNSTETCAEDGYLTIRFRTYWGNSAKQHNVNLVARTDINTPYVYEFFHDATGDAKANVGDGIVAFKMPDGCNMDNDTLTITLRWKSFDKQASGDSIKTTTFKYVPRKD